jgi:glycosyltransferase involved in cell wall biosynthesis
MNDNPLVSVIMNCYNGEKYLNDAVDSVLSQTYQNWEIIFWDNQSSDQSANIFNSYDDCRFKYYYAPLHTLVYEARNCAIEQASGEYIAFLDVDDWWVDDKLEQQIPLFDNPKVGFACSNYWIIDENRASQKLFRKKKLPYGWVLNDLLIDYPVGMLTLILRREAFDTIQGGCNPRFHIIGDMDLVVKLGIKWKMASCQTPLAYYRIHGENEGQKHKKRTVMEYQIWLKELGENKNIVSLPGYKKLHDELNYLKGRTSIDQASKQEALRCLKNLPFGKFKLKLAVLIFLDYFGFNH